MSEGERIGILGGTLDPIHMGHLEMARVARDTMSLDRVIVVPARVPPHRQQQPQASHYHRFALAALAINGADGFIVSDMELCAPGPSYTADTLLRLHATGLRPGQIFFITGADAFAEIETWSRYPDVLDLAHFVVISRPGHPVADLPDRLPALSRRVVRAGSAAAVSGGPAVFLVDATTPDVSSTDIRRRLAAGEPVTGLLPPAVETHIRQHGLYSSADHLHGQD